MRNKQFQAPKHQDRLTEILDARLYISFVFLASYLLLFARLSRFQRSKHFREHSWHWLTYLTLVSYNTSKKGQEKTTTKLRELPFAC